MFFTFETLLLLGITYLISIPLSAISFLYFNKKSKTHSSEDEHEDVL
ncbi:MAG: hypothetical protein ACJZ4O_01345 [Pelagibacteraceae bacterium]